MRRGTLTRGLTTHRKLEVFPYFPKYSIFVAFISQLTQKLQWWSLYEMIEDILPFVLDTERPLTDSWLSRYEQNSFGCNLQNCKTRNSSPCGGHAHLAQKTHNELVILHCNCKCHDHCWSSPLSGVWYTDIAASTYLFTNFYEGCSL